MIGASRSTDACHREEDQKKINVDPVPLWRFVCIEAFQSALESPQQEAPWYQSGDSASDLPPGKAQHLTTPEAAHPRSAASEATGGPVEVVNTLLTRAAGAFLLL